MGCRRPPRWSIQLDAQGGLASTPLVSETAVNQAVMACWMTCEMMQLNAHRLTAREAMESGSSSITPTCSMALTRASASCCSCCCMCSCERAHPLSLAASGQCE